MYRTSPTSRWSPPEPGPPRFARKVTPLALPERRVEVRRLSVFEACGLVKDRLGSAYTPQIYADVAAAWPEGVPEDQIEAICTRHAPLTQGVQADGLRLIGGGAA